MSAQLAAEALGAKRVVAKINDPLRAVAYADLGLATICRTDLMLDAILAYAGLPNAGPRGVQAPTGHHHPGGAHDDSPAEAIPGGADRATGVSPTATMSAREA
jgi:hypothetical protein